MSPLKILSYSSAYVSTGHNAGSEVTLHDLMRNVKLSGHDAVALGARPFKDGSGSFVADGVRVQAHGSKQDPFLYFPSYDVVLSQLETSARAQMICKQLGKTHIQLVHNTTEFSQGIAKHSDYLIWNCENTRNQIEVSRPGVTVYPMVDPSRYRVDRAPLDEGYITLINLSDGTDPFYDKGYRIFYWLAERFPDRKFLGVKGAYGNQCIRTDLPNVTIAEHTANILDVYRKTSVLLVPSTIESFGRVAIEAAASGIPSISTDLPGPREANVSYAYLHPEDFFVWEGALKNLFSDYSRAATSALERSRVLWNTTLEQYESFLSLLERL